jgi:hypothetical protein
MATAERQVTLNEPPEASLQTCVRALTQAGFKNITTGPGLVTARKRPFGQWTKGQISLTITGEGAGSRIDITAQASAQSLIGLAWSPSRRMVNQVARTLGSEAGR